MKYFWVVLLTFLLAQQASAQDVSPRIDLRYKAGNNRQITGSEIFLPLAQNNNSLVFADMRGMGDGQHNKEGNLGVGFRRLEDDHIWGLYGFFDRRQSQFNAYHSQATLGAEILTQNWDLRANGYLPLTDDKVIAGLATPSSIALQGNQVVQTLGSAAVEKSLAGFDVEAGYQVAPGLRLFAGGYSFRADDVPEISGFRGRAQYDVNDYLRLGLEYQQDDVRGENRFAEIRLRIPLGGAKNTAPKGLRKRMAEPIVRDIDIVTFLNRSGSSSGGSSTPAPLINPDTSTPQEIWYVDNSAAGGGDGSVTAPFSTLVDALAVASDGDIVYIHSGTGTSAGLTTPGGSSFNLNSTGLQIIGSGTNLVYNSTTGRIGAGGTGTTLLATGTAPVLTTSLWPVLTVNNTNITIAGLAIDSASNTVVKSGVADVSGLVLKNLALTNNAGGIGLGSLGSSATSGVTLSDITITNGGGISVYNYDNLTLSNIQATNSNSNIGLDLIYDTPGSYTATASNLVLSTHSVGLSLGAAGAANVTYNLTGVTSSNASRGIDISSNNSAQQHIILNNATLNANGIGAKINVQNVATTTTVDMNSFTLTNSSVWGMFSNNNFTLNLNDGTVNNPGAIGIFTDSALAPSTTNIVNTTITGNTRGFSNDYATAVGPSNLNIGAGSSVSGNTTADTTFTAY